MAFDTSDAISVTDIRDRVWDLAEENLQFRRAFDQIQVPEGTDNQWQIPTDDDALAEPQEVREGSAYPADEEAYSTVTFTRTKYGQMIPVTDEAVMDNIFPIITRLVDKQGRKFQEKLDAEAFSILDNNQNSDGTITSGSGGLAYADVLAAKKELRADGYNPDLLIVEENGEENLLNDSNFTRDTDMGDAIVQNGELTSVSGLDVVVSNTGDMSANRAFVVDTDFYGVEAVWMGMEMEEVEDRKADTTYLKARTFRDWQAVDAEANIKINSA